MQYVSMLRGINVGGQKRVSMQTLKEGFSAIGLKEVQSYVQSGNVVFSTNEDDISKLKKQIETKIKQTIRFDVSVFLRTRADLLKIVKKSPFKQRDETKLHVTFLYERPAAVPLDELKSARVGEEEFSVSGSEIYLFCPNGYGVTKLSNSFFEKKLKVSATTRNWRTVNTLLTMMSG